MKVCWQVTGIRSDRWAEANPLVVEPKKIGKERGTYVHPHLYGKSDLKTAGAALNPKTTAWIQSQTRQIQRRVAAERVPAVRKPKRLR
jgi:hypothetical protein